MRVMVDTNILVSAALFRDEKDYPILMSAGDGDIDVLISGDKDFADVDCERPEILTPLQFKERYL